MELKRSAMSLQKFGSVCIPTPICELFIQIYPNIYVLIL